VVAEDFGIKKWWAEPKMMAEAREKGYI